MANFYFVRLSILFWLPKVTQLLLRWKKTPENRWILNLWLISLSVPRNICGKLTSSSNSYAWENRDNRKVSPEKILNRKKYSFRGRRNFRLTRKKVRFHDKNMKNTFFRVFFKRFHNCKKLQILCPTVPCNNIISMIAVFLTRGSFNPSKIA